MDPDLELARRLQQQFDQEANAEMAPFLPEEYRSPQKKASGLKGKLSVVSDEWETIDPTPDLHALFLEFNTTFFWGKLLCCEVRWSPRMTTCAGICRYSPRERFCTIGISIPLLKLRPRKDLVETLLHEMIHAYLFITDNNKDHDGHGPEFHKHMYRINAATGANISVYHTFHDEVALYKQHWWRCDGPCKSRPPFYGFVKRAMNKAPGPNDRWWMQHENSCGGTYTKVKEPEGYGQKKTKEKKDVNKNIAGQKDIRTMFGSTKSPAGGSSNPIKKPPTDKGRFGGIGHTSGASSAKVPAKKPSAAGTSKGKSAGVSGGGGMTKFPSKRPSDSGSPKAKKGGGGRGNIFGFGGTSFSSPGLSGGGSVKTAGRPGTFVVRPGWNVSDNSSAGSAFINEADKENIKRPDMPRPTRSPLKVKSSSTSTTVGTAGMPAGPGFKLGGGSGGSGGMNSSTAGMSARDMARLRWASSQSSSSQTTAAGSSASQTGSGSSSGSGSSGEVLNLGAKSSRITKSQSSQSKSVIKETVPISSAKTSATGSSSQPNSSSKAGLLSKTGSSSSLSGMISGQSVKPVETAKCPVCSVTVPQERINNHLDICLNKLGTSKAKDDDNSVDLFDDCDDDLLLQAVDEADRTLSNSIISVNDSEDEDMFNDERDDDDDVFAEVVSDDGPLLTKLTSKNDSLDQDDQDLLVALEVPAGSVNSGSDKFACPVCQKLVANRLMNAHLDNCLK